MRQVDTDHDYYELLEVPRDASTSDIQASYRRLMQRAGNHPDLGGDTRIAALINKAYAVLKDPAQRADYDMRRDILTLITMGFSPRDAANVMNPDSSCAFCGQPYELAHIPAAEDSCGTCGSPLQRVEPSRTDSGSGRAVERLDRSLNTVLYTHWQQSRGYAATTEDISPRGVRLITFCEIRPGQVVRLFNNVLEAVGEVTHSAPRNDGWLGEIVAGIAFKSLRFKHSAGGFVSRSA